MSQAPIDIRDALRKTLDDRRLSRSERQALGALLDDLDESRYAEVRREAFELARGLLGDGEPQLVLAWLEDVVQTLSHATRPDNRGDEIAEAWFSPDDDCVRRIVDLIAEARRTVDICVFTITDDRITGAILDAHRGGTSVRVATDDEKAHDLGSDIARLRSDGVSVRIDRSPSHMHHKFAVFDGTRLLTGSYNWTRGAALHNEENFIVTSDRRLVSAYARKFDALWKRFAGH